MRSDCHPPQRKEERKNQLPHLPMTGGERAAAASPMATRRRPYARTDEECAPVPETAMRGAPPLDGNEDGPPGPRRDEEVAPRRDNVECAPVPTHVCNEGHLSTVAQGRCPRDEAPWAPARTAPPYKVTEGERSTRPNLPQSVPPNGPN